MKRAEGILQLRWARLAVCAMAATAAAFMYATSTVRAATIVKLKKPTKAERLSFSQRVLNAMHINENALMQELGLSLRAPGGHLNEELLREISTTLWKTKTYNLADSDLKKVRFFDVLNLVPSHHPEHGMPPHPFPDEYKEIFDTVDNVLSRSRRKKAHPVLTLTAPSVRPSAKELDEFDPDKIARRLGVVFAARDAFHQNPKVRRELANQDIALRTVFEQTEGDQIRHNPVEPIYIVRLNYTPKTETQSSPVLSFMTVPNKNAVAGVDELVKIKTINRLIEEYNADYRMNHDW